MTPDLTPFKRQAALAAVDLVKPGMRVGLGTGSTAFFAVDEICRRYRAGQLPGLVGVPTSTSAEEQALSGGLPLGTLDAELDVTIDGADEVCPNVDVIKGLGGALVREKIVAFHSRLMVIVADETKRVARLGEKAPLPVEILAWNSEASARAVTSLGARVTWRQRDGQPVISDNGNPILDCVFPGPFDPRTLETQLRLIPGVVCTGFFLGMARVAYLAGPDGVSRLERPRETGTAAQG
ncbi:MAG TPA: ribose-5-phosphate isomerase RpiA [Deinococcales bacterium]|nr:ribose-5-phosphate isomerase RpiA [Deinococcales bacterium]